MKTADFFFDLPSHLIAQHPPVQRGQSRLMVLDRITGKITHRMVEDLPEILSGPEFRGKGGEPPLLVFNDSKVRKARLIGKSLQTGAKVEFLLLERAKSKEQRAKEDKLSWSPSSHCSLLTANCSLNWKVLVQRSKRRKTGSTYAFFDNNGAEVAKATIVDGEREFRFLEFDRPIDDEWLDRYGHIPLPPYIRRDDSPDDADRYQTVYADVAGSAAAPTAGLHFTRELLDRLAAAGIETAFITLHVGLGTFLPVRSTNIEDHVMHEESFSIDEETAAKIEKAKAEGRKVIAVGTTSVRTLESAWDSTIPSPQSLVPGPHSTSIFIYPGYQFKAVDHLFTNFHTPESTLLMLVSAFADANSAGKSGRELILESYAEAVREGYRFFSYGDAMLIV
jgi:S-adenosylmethionine:tRNA ribosyltransferase-isomerase